MARHGEGAAVGGPRCFPQRHRRQPRRDRGVGFPRRPHLRLRRNLRRRVRPEQRAWLAVPARRQRRARCRRFRACAQVRARGRKRRLNDGEQPGDRGATGRVVETMIPRRLDALPWSRWHWLIVVGLGVTWILDGFEVTLVGALAGVLTRKDTLHLSTQQALSLGTWYLLGAGTCRRGRASLRDERRYF